MSNELTFTCAGTFYKPSVMGMAVGRSWVGQQLNVSGSPWIEGTVSCPTSAQAIPLGQVTAPHWAYFHNLDATNYLTIRNGASGADLIQLKPGEQCWVPLLSTCTPYTLANTAACLLEYLIVSA